ncbi:MAG TPA: hypothetical protein VFC00_17610 [Micromonosporaceae bacterium]|nr:hypothetical protein [Micromonosporaceae bacterium]
MHLVTVTLRHEAGEPPAEAGRIAAVLRAVARPEHGLEHAYVQPAAFGAVAVLFLVAPTLDAAQRSAAELVDLVEDALRER